MVVKQNKTKAKKQKIKNGIRNDLIQHHVSYVHEIYDFAYKIQIVNTSAY